MNQKKKKKSIVKKVLKWIVGTLLFLIILLATAPYLFKHKIRQMVENTINKNINATVSFEDLDLSFFKNFPLANVKIKNTKVINKLPFEGDTLFYAQQIDLNMKITELFKGKEETMQLKSFSTNNSLVNILTNKEGNTNYDIVISKESTQASSELSSSFSLGIQKYTISNMSFIYHDSSSQLKMKVDSIYHSGVGNFKQNILDLDTHTKAYVSLDMNNSNYMNRLPVAMDAIIGIDLENSKYSFKENKGFINQLPLEFSGFIQLVGDEGNQLYDLSFKTPTSSFKNLLAVLPAQYSGDLETIKTEGNFDTKGFVKGTLSKETIPTFDISFVSRNAMFHYPNLPKSVQDINVNSRIVNSTGNLNDTYVSIKEFAFRIDKDVFNANGKVSNIIENPNVNLMAKGTINLENLSKAYPITLEQQFSGILKADVSSSFDMNSVTEKKYQNIKNTGLIRLDRFKYEGKDVAKPFFIEKTSVSFNPDKIKLNDFIAKTGDSDINVQGNLQNFYGFLFKNEVLKGDFTLRSNQLKVSDFMTTSEETTQKGNTTEQVVKIPAFLDCKFKASAKRVVYDDISLSNVSGDIVVKDETIDLRKLDMRALGGLIKLNGKVSTKEKVADFAMNLNLQGVDIQESFSKLTSLKSIAPIANVIGGKMNSTFKISGDLLQDLTPNLKTISGDLLGVLLGTKLKAENSKVLSYLGKEVSFIDIDKLNLEKVKTYITFKDGNVVVKPFKVKYKDINVNIGGTHSFDQSMNYNLVFDVPAKHLGKDVTNLLSKLSKKEQNDIGTVPVKATLSGNFSNPQIKTDIKQATSDFTTKLVKQQKDKLVNKGKDKLLNLLNKKGDTNTKKTGQKLLNSLFKKKKKKKN